MIRALAAIGSLYGLVIALGLAGLRFVNSNQAALGEEWLGDLAFGVVYAAPFALSLLALWFNDDASRAAVWLGTAVLAFLGAFTAFSGVTLLLLPASVLLFGAGGMALARAVKSRRVRSLGLIGMLSLAFIGVGAAAFLALFVLRADPRCWVLHRYPDGRLAWETAPAEVASIQVTTDLNGQTVTGSGVGAASQAGIVSTSCTSDIVTPLEAGISLGLWMLMALGLVFWQRAGVATSLGRVAGA